MSKILRLLRVLHKKQQPIITPNEALQIAHHYVVQKGYILEKPPALSEEMDAYCVDLSPGQMRVNCLSIDFVNGRIIKHVASPL